MADIVDMIRANVRRSRLEAKEILADPDTVILDTETTGLSNAYIVDLAVIRKGGIVFNTLVDPQVRIPKDASAIHGIYNRHVRDAPTFTDLWSMGLADVLKNKRVVIYNVPYDMGVIQHEMKRLDDTYDITVRTEDALTLYQRWYFGGSARSGRGQTKLTTAHCDAPACVAAVSTHEEAGAHRAYADCLATVARLRMIAETCWIDEHYREGTKNERQAVIACRR